MRPIYLVVFIFEHAMIATDIQFAYGLCMNLWNSKNSIFSENAETNFFELIWAIYIYRMRCNDIGTTIIQYYTAHYPVSAHQIYTEAIR